MISAAWAWLSGTRVGRWIAGAALAALALLAIRADAYRDGRKDGEREHEEADRKRADDVRQRADDARRRSAVDPRDVNDRLRRHGRLRD